MDNNSKRQVKKYLMDYLKKVVPNFQMKGKMFTCPKCGELTANIFPVESYSVFCYTPECQKIGDIFDMVRYYEYSGCEDVSKDEIAEDVIKMFNIKINDDENKLFDKYEKLVWDMVPVSKNSKASNIESEWQNKSHKDRAEWEQWIDSGINIGVKTGKMSNIVVIDLDLVGSNLKKRIYEGKPTEKMLENAKLDYDINLDIIKDNLPFLDWETLQQKTFGGVHLIYQYDAEIPKTTLDIKGIHVDIQSDGGQVVVEPSIVGGQNRQIIGDEIKPLPEELKKYILENSSKVEVKEEVMEEVANTDLTFESLNGNRNNTFIKLYGELRKEMPIKVAYNTLRKFNKLLDKKLPLKELQAMSREAEKYHEVDIKDISSKIIEHFKMVKHEVHLRDLKEVLNIERKDIEEALCSLVEQKKIYREKKDLYRFISDVEWRTDFLKMSKPLDIIVPYFNQFARFNEGSMIVIGGKTGHGKTHIVINMMEQFVKQGICPKLITTEADSGVGEISLARGMKEGDFKFFQTSRPTDVLFQDDEVRIIDWLKAPNSEFYMLDSIYEELNNKLVDHRGLLIVFAQLKSDGTFYADDMVQQFASFVGKFLYPERNGVADNLHPIIQSTKIRRPKTHRQYVEIPLEYNPDTKELKMR